MNMSKTKDTNNPKHATSRSNDPNDQGRTGVQKQSK